MKRLITLLILVTPLFFATTRAATPPGPAIVGPGFTLNPNPVSGQFFDINLEFTENEYPSTIIYITNVLGQVVYTYQLKHTDFMNGKVRIDVTDAKLDKGVYFVQLKSGEATKTLKLAVR